MVKKEQKGREDAVRMVNEERKGREDAERRANEAEKELVALRQCLLDTHHTVV